MKKNLGLSLGMWNSQTVLLALIRKGLTREEAYELVQRNAMKTWEVKHAGRDDADFVQVLARDPDVARHFRKGELQQLCSLDFHFKEVRNRFQQVGLGGEEKGKAESGKRKAEGGKRKAESGKRKAEGQSEIGNRKSEMAG